MHSTPYSLNKQPMLIKRRGGWFPKIELLKTYKFYFNHNGQIAYFTIPKGFKYDGATFGSFLFWRREMHTSPFTLAHDWSYKVLFKVQARYVDEDGEDPEFINSQVPFDISKEEADVIFLEGARRYHNIQNWRTHIASGVFKTVSHIPVILRKLKWID